MFINIQQRCSMVNDKMEQDTNNFAEFVRQSREKKGWSLQDLAGKTGLSRSYIHHIENGTREPPEETINKLKAVLSGQQIDIVDLVASHLTKEQARCLRLFNKLSPALREHYIECARPDSQNSGE